MRTAVMVGLAALTALVAGCVTGQSHLEACEEGAACTPPLECLQPAIVREGEGCLASELGGIERQACHRRCETDLDCDVLGTGYTCAIVGCPGSDRVCLPRSENGAAAASVER